MTKKLKRPLAFFSAFVMVMALLLYFPSGTFSNIDWGIKASAVEMTQPAGDGTSGSPYQIGTKEQLYWFANMVNNENATYGNANAVLTANIVVNKNVLSAEGELNSGDFTSWTPIGGNEFENPFYYTGTFDGQGHTVSGLYFYDESAEYVGLFGYVGSGGSVSNVGVVDSYFFSNGDYVGGVCGDTYGTLTNCYNVGTINGGAYSGGVCGNNGGTITNCYNTGTVSGIGAFIGGVCGYNYGYYGGKIENCYNTGTVSGGGTVGGVCGIVFKGTITNCYNTGSVSGTNNRIGGVCGSNAASTTQNCYNTGTVSGLNGDGGVSGDNRENGSITNCYYNSDVYKGNAVGNNLSGTIGADVLGKSTADFSSSAVCTDVGYHSHKINGFCSLCRGDYEPAVLNDGTFEISNAGQLYWFARYINGMISDVTPYTAAKAVLTADITVNQNVLNADGSLNTANSGSFKAWTPIASGSNKYTGTFNGQNHTVSGLYFDNSSTGNVGLFGYIEEGSISNVGVVDSYFNGRDSVGGVCAYNTSGTITNCYNTSTVIGNECVSGVCGYTNTMYNMAAAKIENCYNTGAVTGKMKVGGVCGWSNGSAITNCYNIGAVTGENDVSGVCGYADCTITNCYYLGTAASGIGSGSAVSKTQKQFESGEVAYLLNDSTSTDTSVWHQNIDSGTRDTYPVLDASHGIVYQCTPCTAVYSNTQKEAPHEFTSNGETQHICENCGVTQAHTTAYTANDTEHSISAKCSVCQHNFGSVTLKAPADLTYDGSAKAATLTGNITAAGYIAPTISYKKDNKAFNGTPTDAGDYTASITIGDKTVSVDYTIGKAAVNEINITGITAPKAGEALDTTADSPAAEAGYTLSDVTWSPSDVTAGYNQKYQVSVKVTPTANYQFASGVTAKINAKEATVVNNENGTYTVSYTFGATDRKTLTLTLDNDTKTYNGNVQTITPATKPNDYNGEITYKYYTDKNCQNETTSENGATENGGAPKNAGTYYVKAKAPEYGIYAEATATATYVIHKAEVSEITITGIDIPAAGTALDTTAETSDAGYTLSDVTWSPSDVTAGYNQEYQVSVKITPTANYQFASGVTAKINAKEATVVNNENGTYTVSYTFSATDKKTLTLTLDNDTKTYNGEIQKIKDATVDAEDYHGVITYKYYTDESRSTPTSEQNGGADIEGGAPKNAGTYYVEAIAPEYDIYAGKTATATYVINKAVVDKITITGIDIPEAGKVLDTEAVTSDTRYTLGAVTWKLGDEAVNGNAGYNKAYTAYVVVTPTANYKFAENVKATINAKEATVVNNEGGTYTVSYIFGATVKKVPTITLESDTAPHIYNGSVQGIATVAKVEAGNSGKVSYKYYIDEECKNETTSENGATENGGAPKNAGTYYVKATVEANDIYAEATSDPATYVIEKATLTVVGAKAENRVYDPASKNVTITAVTLNGICDNDDVSVDVTNLTGTISSTNAGVYIEVTLMGTLTLTGTAAGNYTLTQPTEAVSTNVTIEKADNVPNTPTNLTGCIGAKLSTVSLESYPNWSWDEPDTTLHALNVGDTYPAKASYNGSDKDNYKNVTNVGLTVTLNAHPYSQDGFCTKCGAYQPATDSDSDGKYEIGNAGQLYWFADKVNNDNKNFGNANAVLTGNIVVNENVLDTDGKPNKGPFEEWTPIGNTSNPYTGTFDGNGYTVGGLYFDDPNASDVGLFGCNNGTIQNVNVNDSYFNAGSDVGGVCGSNGDNGTITNCDNAGTVSGTTNVGGVCGNNNSGSITSSDNTGNVSTSGDNASVGGVCGSNTNSGEINDCSNGGEVTGTGASSSAGGICGENSSSSITNSDNTGKVSGTNNAGGVCGNNNGGTITSSNNTGNVSTSGNNAFSGGVCGSNTNSGKINDCSNKGEVTGTGEGSSAGGVCGENSNSSITNSDNTGKVSGTTNAGGVCGNNNSGSITSSDNTGNVSTSGNNAFSGGVCGSNTSNGTITGCKNEGEVTTEGADSSAGGVCGSNTSKGEITNSDNTGKVSGTTNAGGVCGSNTDSGKINDCSNKGEVTGTGEGSSAGGVCGENNSGTIENSNNTGSISGTNNAGGVCGNNNSGSITSSDNTGNVSTSGDNASSGGVCGSNTSNGTITGCKNEGEVTTEGADSSAGGVCGSNTSKGEITNSDNTGKVSGTTNAGGVCGSNADSGKINDCSNKGEVTGTDEGSSAGGVCGENNSGTIENSNNTGSISGTTNAGGVCGNNNSGTITSSNNTGTVSGTGEGSSTGGVCGSNTDSGKIDDCYNKGTVTGTGEGSSAGGVCGSNDANSIIDDCYYLEGSAESGIGSNTNNNTNENSAISTPEKDFSNGTVCDTLGYHSYQNGICKICGALENGRDGFKSASITLTDGIILNYFLILSDEALADKNAYVHFTSEQGLDTKIMLSKGVLNNGRYKFSLKLIPDQMADVITAKVVYSDGTSGKSVNYSVKRYADNKAGKVDEKTSKLINAMLYYGAATQKYTGNNIDNPADKNVTEKFDPNVSIPNEYKMSLEGTANGIKVKGASLIAGSLTTIKVKYEVTAGSISDFTFTCDGTKLTPVKEGSYYYVYIKNINPTELDKMYNIVVTDKAGNKKTLKYGALTYAKSVVEAAAGKYDSTLVDMMKALYYYNKAADAYSS